MTVFSLWFSGGAELLFNKVKEHEVLLPKDENPCEQDLPFQWQMIYTETICSVAGYDF